MRSFAKRTPHALGLLMALALMSIQTAHAQLPSFFNNTDERPTLAPLLEEVTPAVVNISVTGKGSMQRNPLFGTIRFFRRFFNFPNQGPVVPRQSVGSGVIVDARRGYVLTQPSRDRQRGRGERGRYKTDAALDAEVIGQRRGGLTLRC